MRASLLLMPYSLLCPCATFLFWLLFLDPATSPPDEPNNHLSPCSVMTIFWSDNTDANSCDSDRQIVTCAHFVLVISKGEAYRRRVRFVLLLAVSGFLLT